jgi:tetratricopeptide (TPR) repeat protein
VIRRPLALLLPAALGAALLGGCVYYNGMYNAKRLAGSARNAEREGRTFDANNLWGQVITRADSLMVRHPRSKYVNEAMVLKGIALARLGQCTDAVNPLGRVTLLRDERTTSEEAALALGRCQMELGDPTAAALAFAQVLESAEPGRRAEARLQHARALRQLGRPDEALLALEGLGGTRVAEERLLALGSTGRAAEALALADTLLTANDSARSWDSVISIIARARPRTASALVDRLAARADTRPDVRARRFYEDAVRLEPVDSARAVERFRLVARTGPATDYRDRAAFQLVRRDLRRVASVAELAPIADSLSRIVARGGSAAPEAKLLLGSLTSVRVSADSSGPSVDRGDMRLFLAAETARDTLAARELAAGMFRQLVETWPDSPYAPKALLAGRMLDPAWGESVRPLLDERYAASPYLSFLRGEDPVGYRQLEDSLQTYAFGLAARQRQQAQPGVRRPGAPRLPPGRQPARQNPPRPQTTGRGLEP